MLSENCKVFLQGENVKDLCFAEEKDQRVLSCMHLACQFVVFEGESFDPEELTGSDGFCVDFCLFEGFLLPEMMFLGDFGVYYWPDSFSLNFQRGLLNQLPFFQDIHSRIQISNTENL